MLDLTLRNQLPEIMDQPGLALIAHERALQGLERINWVSLSDRILWRAIRHLSEANNRQPLRVLDIATGGGDVPIRLHRRAQQAKLPIAFAGADINPAAVNYARRQARRNEADIDFFRLDALHTELPTDYDVITCSLFLHHLDNVEAVDLLRRMGKSARSMVLINDLIRSRLGYLLAWLGTRLLSASPIVHADGLQSVRAAFTMREALGLAEQSGLAGASIAWRWPFRYLLRWIRPGLASCSAAPVPAF